MKILPISDGEGDRSRSEWWRGLYAEITPSPPRIKSGAVPLPEQSSGRIFK